MNHIRQSNASRFLNLPDALLEDDWEWASMGPLLWGPEVGIVSDEAPYATWASTGSTESRAAHRRPFHLAELSDQPESRRLRERVCARC